MADAEKRIQSDAAPFKEIEKMSNSDIKPPSTYYMPGARIKMIVSENDKLKVREGKINSVNKEMKTIDITLQTIDKKNSRET